MMTFVVRMSLQVPIWTASCVLSVANTGLFLEFAFKRECWSRWIRQERISWLNKCDSLLRRSIKALFLQDGIRSRVISHVYVGATGLWIDRFIELHGKHPSSVFVSWIYFTKIFTNFHTAHKVFSDVKLKMSRMLTEKEEIAFIYLE